MEIITKIIGCLIAAGLIGLVVGWLLGRLRGSGATNEEKESWEARLRSSERDLDKVRGDLKSHRDQVAALKSELTASTDRLKLRDREFGDLEAKLKSLLPLESDLAGKTKEISALTLELGSLRTKLAEAEAELKKPAQPDPKLTTELNTVKQTLAGKDNEISTLLLRVKELAPLSLQIKDRDIRLHEWETKHNNALKGKDYEIAKLNHSLKDFDAKMAGLQASVQGKDSEIQMLQARVGDLGPLQAELSTLRASLEGKDSELQMLQARAGDLGPLQAELSALKASLEGKDSEIQMLQARAGEIEPLRIQLNDCGAKLQAAEGKLVAQASAAELEAEVARLRSRVHDLETMHLRALTPPPEEEWDDLEAINGVGPVLAKMLNRLGIYTFKQVAVWNDKQVEWVDRQLEDFHGRIERENWIESAKDEHFKKYGERI